MNRVLRQLDHGSTLTEIADGARSVSEVRIAPVISVEASLYDYAPSLLSTGSCCNGVTYFLIIVITSKLVNFVQ